MEDKIKLNGYTRFGKVLRVFGVFAFLYLVASSYSIIIILATLVNIFVLSIIFIAIGKNRRMIEQLYERLHIEIDEY